jgi:CRP-like cAMP-binding protein
LLPGDFIGPVLEPRLPSFCAIAPLTEIGAVNAKPFADAAMAPVPAYPTLARAARLATHLQDALLCEQIARLGQQNAGERFAHLMLELHYRLGLIGRVNGHSFALPLTQDVLADALGLSAVHLNRTLKQLRRDGLLKLESGHVTLLQPETLRSMAGWAAPRYPNEELR